MAVNLTVATIALSILLDDTSGNAWKGIVLGGIMGISGGLVALWNSWKWYERIDAGEFREVHMTTKQQMIRYGGILIFSIVVISLTALRVMNARQYIGFIAVLMSLSLLLWMMYFTVFVWERRRHKVVAADKRSMYAIDME